MLIRTHTWRYVASIFLLASMWATACKADEDSAQNEGYKQRREIEGQLFRAGLHHFGDQLRAQAIAAACGKKELVDSIGPSLEDVASFLVGEMAREDAWNDRRRAFLHGITTEETVELALIVSDTLLVGYRSGYIDATRAVKLDLAAFELLGERRFISSLIILKNGNPDRKIFDVPVTHHLFKSAEEALESTLAHGRSIVDTIEQAG